jgi:hypothetical protein
VFEDPLDRRPVQHEGDDPHRPAALGTRQHGHLDSAAVRAPDAADHAGGWSVDASVTIAEWNRHGLERLVRYCARPSLSQERLGRLDAEH